MWLLPKHVLSAGSQYHVPPPPQAHDQISSMWKELESVRKKLEDNSLKTVTTPPVTFSPVREGVGGRGLHSSLTSRLVGSSTKDKMRSGLVWAGLLYGMVWAGDSAWDGMGAVHGILSCMYLVGSWTLAY